MITRPLVSVIDDDESVRESLPYLLKDLALQFGLSLPPRSIGLGSDFAKQVSDSRYHYAWNVGT
jgi:hypothetical protein